MIVSENEKSQKRIILILFSCFFIIMVAFILNRSQSIRVQSDLFSRWYLTSKLFDTGRDQDDVQIVGKETSLKLLPQPLWMPVLLTSPPVDFHVSIGAAAFSNSPFSLDDWNSTLFSPWNLGCCKEVGVASKGKPDGGVFSNVYVVYPCYLAHFWGRFDTIGVIGLVLFSVTSSKI